MLCCERACLKMPLIGNCEYILKISNFYVCSCVCVYRSAIVCRFLISSTWLIRACTAPTNCIFKYPLSHLLFNMLLLLWKCNKMPKRLTCHPINCGCSRFVCDLNRCTLFESLGDFRAIKISWVASKASFIQSKFHGRIAI